MTTTTATTIIIASQIIKAGIVTLIKPAAICDFIMALILHLMNLLLKNNQATKVLIYLKKLHQDNMIKID